MDDTALSYAEIKALATGNPYIKEKMDLDIQVSKLKLLKANHTSQVYSLESDIARRYPREITAAKGQIEALKNDMEAAKPLLAQDKDHFAMEISGKVYSERKEVQDKIEQFKAEESVKSVVPGTVRAAAEQAENFLHGTRLTASMVSAFIENVYVHEGGRIVVQFKYEQSIQDAVRALHTD